tara:strand:+ start:4452 stop:4703 length:252 start_codon:yes stop_codon:yes gene_type:complete
MIEHNDDLEFTYEITNNHVGKPTLHLYGVDSAELCDGFTHIEINKLIVFLEEQRLRIEERLNEDSQNMLFEPFDEGNDNGEED